MIMKDGQEKNKGRLIIIPDNEDMLRLLLDLEQTPIRKKSNKNRVDGGLVL